MAVHAEELLDKPAIARDLGEALERCALSIGTTARARAERPLLTPREAAERAVAARGQVAFVFGDERSGLTAAEVGQVDLLSRIPGAQEQPSWNLAQAVAIYAYEARAAALGRKPPAAREEADPAALAAIDRALAEALTVSGKPGARRRLFKALERARLSPRDAALWVAFLKAKKK